MSSYNPKTHTARVTFDDLDGIVSGDLQILQPGSTRMRVKMPLQVGDHVACLFQANGLQEGYILGTPYTSSNLPDDGDENDYVMHFPGQDVKVRINTASGKVEVLAPNSEVAATAKNANIEVAEGLSASAKTASVSASESMTTTAPIINLNGVVNASSPDGSPTTVNFNGNFNVTGNFNITGNISASGNINAGGDIMATGSSDNHHSH